MPRLASIVVLLLPAVAMAADAPAITVSDAWSRATVGTTAAGVAYLTIVDAGPADALTGVSTPIAKSATLHETTHGTGGMIGMSAVTSLPIPADGTVKLAPGGYHIMFTHLTEPLVKGETVKATLTFEHAGPVAVDFSVEGIGAAGPAMKGGAMGKMKM